MVLASMSISDIVKKIRRKEISVTELLMEHILNVEKNNQKVGAFIHCDFNRAIKRAEEIQALIDSGQRVGSLCGIPFAVSANVFYNGGKCNCGSLTMKNHIPDYSATVVKRLEDAGAICIGTLNCEEFSLGGVGNTCLNGTIRTPWRTSRAGGATSAGTAVVLGMCCFSISTDTEGEARVAAAFNSVSTLLPSMGTVSRYGVCDPCPSLTAIGITARNITDCASILQIISGPDGKDGSCTKRRAILPMYDVTKFKIGVPAQPMQALSPEIRSRILTMPDALYQCGAEAEVFSLPLYKEALAAHRIISCAEWAMNTSKFLNDPLSEDKTDRINMLSYGLKSRLMYGNYILMSDNYQRLYMQALKVRQMVCDATDKLLEKYKLFIFPVVLSDIPKTSDKQSNEIFYSDYSLPNVIVNLTGLPSAVVSCGFTSDGLPVGCQIIGAPDGESAVMSAAATFQKFTNYHSFIPKV